MKQSYFFAGVGVLGLLGLIIDDNYLLHILILCLIWSMVVAAWDLVMGYAGIFNFAQLVFFAVGAYVMAMVSINYGLPPIAAIPIAAVIGALFGLLVGLPCLRLRGEYVALFTFAVHLAMPTLIQQSRALETGGSTGLLGIPPLDLGFVRLFPHSKLAWFYVALVTATAIVYFIYFVVLRGRWGRAFVCLRDSEAFAKSLGVNDFKYKLLVFTVSAFATAIAGAIYSNYVGVVTPKILGNEFFLMVMLMLSIGGLGRFPGAILGAFIITIGNELLRDAGQYRLFLLGACVVAAVLFMPAGLVSLRDRLASLVSIKNDPSDLRR